MGKEREGGFTLDLAPLTLFFALSLVIIDLAKVNPFFLKGKVVNKPPDVP